MPLSINITSETNNAIALLGQVRAGIARGDLQKGAGEAVAVSVRRRFHKLSRERHRANKPTGNSFYAEAADATRYRRENSKQVFVDVTAPRGLRQRLRGGTLPPKNAKMLAIPVHPQVYGLSPSDPKVQSLGLQFVPTGRAAVLMQPQEGTGFGTVFYVLKKSITQKPDPSVLPAQSTLYENARKGAAAAANYLTRKQP